MKKLLRIFLAEKRFSYIRYNHTTEVQEDVRNLNLHPLPLAYEKGILQTTINPCGKMTKHA